MGQIDDKIQEKGVCAIFTLRFLPGFFEQFKTILDMGRQNLPGTKTRAPLCRSLKSDCNRYYG